MSDDGYGMLERAIKGRPLIDPTRYFELRDFMNAIGHMETAAERAAEQIDNATCLRDLADSLQRVREHYWPLLQKARSLGTWPLQPACGGGDE